MTRITKPHRCHDNHTPPVSQVNRVKEIKDLNHLQWFWVSFSRTELPYGSATGGCLYWRVQKVTQKPHPPLPHRAGWGVKVSSSCCTAKANIRALFSPSWSLQEDKKKQIFLQNLSRNLPQQGLWAEGKESQTSWINTQQRNYGCANINPPNKNQKFWWKLPPLPPEGRKKNVLQVVGSEQRPLNTFNFFDHLSTANVCRNVEFLCSSSASVPSLSCSTTRDKKNANIQAQEYQESSLLSKIQGHSGRRPRDSASSGPSSLSWSLKNKQTNEPNGRFDPPELSSS